MSFRAAFFIEHGHACRANEQFPEQWTRRERAANGRKVRGGAWIDMRYVTLYGTARLEPMTQAAGHPDGALRRHEPQSMFDLAGDNAPQRQHKLMFLVPMEVDFLPLQASDDLFIDLLPQGAIGADRHERARYRIGIGPSGGVEIGEVAQNGHGEEFEPGWERNAAFA